MNLNIDMPLVGIGAEVARSIDAGLDSVSDYIFVKLVGETLSNRFTLDMRRLDYISSAGLRVLLVMRKALGDEDHFNMIHMNEVVSEIMETTGFASILCWPVSPLVVDYASSVILMALDSRVSTMFRGIAP